MQKNNYIFNNLLQDVLEKLYNSHITIISIQNNFLKIQETKKLTTTTITAIIALNSKSCRLIFKAVENNVH